MEAQALEICVKGKYYSVPTIPVKGKNIIVVGRLLRMAIIHAEEWSETALEDPDKCVKRLLNCRDNELKADIFTFTQRLPDTKPKYAYPMVYESVAAIPLTTFAHWWENRLPQETRKNVRRSVKRGVITRVQDLDDELVQGIVQLNNETPIRQGKPYDHYGKTFYQVKKDQSSFPDRSDFIAAYAGNELIGFMKLVYCGNIATILQFIIKNAAYDKRPANALMAKAVDHCINKGVSYLVYGLYAYGNKRTSSLVEFKKRNGFVEFNVPRFYIPLTIRGRIAIASNCHRDLVTILPEWLIRIGLVAREQWCKSRLWVSRCSSMLERPNSIRQTECSIPPAGSNRTDSQC